jgi:RNA polymerase sigma-70 factor (ECF subfamily)
VFKVKVRVGAAKISNLSDPELVDRAKRHDGEAFSELVERHHRSALRTATAILRRYEDAEDEVQNSFLKVFCNLEQFEVRSGFRTWLTRIVVNQCLMKLRRTTRMQFLPINDGVLREPSHHDLNPEDECSREEARHITLSYMDRLSPTYREPLRLFSIEELPLELVAQELGLSEAAVKSRLVRARAELRRRWMRHM